MKNGILFFFISFFLLVFPIRTFAQSDTGWVIENFESEITVNQDASVKVKETIGVDFANNERHGIFRTIPVRYKDGLNNNLNIRFNLLGVTDYSGNRLKVEKINEGNNLKLKIGDPDEFVSGKNTYVIIYEVERVVTTPHDEAELYWNATGNEWPVPILSAKAVIKSENVPVLETVCFTGGYGSTSENCKIASENSEVVISTTELMPYEGLTFAIMLDKESLSFPTTTQNLFWFLKDNWIYSVPIIVFFFMLSLYFQKGRDKQFRNIISETGETIVPLFSRLNPIMAFSPPKNLSPGEVGVLVDEKIHQRDITAVVIDLARRGFFKIREEQKGKIFRKSEFTFTLMGKDERALKSFEKSVLDMLFGESREKTVKLNKLHKNAYKNLGEIKTGLYEHLTSSGYFAGNPQKVFTFYLVIGIAVIFLGMFIAPVIAIFTSLGGAYFGFILSGLIIILFSFFMPARTPKGRKALEEIAGLKEYLRVGAWRQKQYEKHNFFEEALAFTIVFGMTDKFIKAFKEADIRNLDWYQSSNAINAVSFNRSLGSINSSLVASAAATAPKSASSGGSGFSGGGSGGGFGGGGGGSW